MELHLTEKQYRRLLDLVYIGNWVLNSTRGDDRIRDYDQVESLIFSHCLDHGMAQLIELYNGEIIPSRAFAEGGIHEAIMAYEDVTFFEILAATADESDPSYSSVVSLLNGYMPLMIDLVRSDRGTFFLPSPSHPPDFFIHQRGAASDEFGHLGGVFDEISADPSQTSPVIVASASLVTKKMYCMDALLSICTVFSFFSFFDYA